ncbi:Alpha-1 3/1 6-mannosyltransferase ALG2 [Bienertia sinuspersici]
MRSSSEELLEKILRQKMEVKVQVRVVRDVYGNNKESIKGVFPVTVYGDFLPRHIFYRLHAVCAYIRCIFVALCVLLMWPSFDVILADQVSIVIPVLKLKSSMKVVFYCHFPDLLLAKHTTLLRKIYRKPIDFIEERTTGMADLVLVNSKFTAATFANTFKHLDAGGVRPSVLYPAVNVDQFGEARAFKLLTLEGNNANDVTLTIAGGYDKRLRENVEYLEELKLLAQRERVADQVNFITSCSTSERNILLSRCLCVLYTPQDEHFGIVPLEAMAAYKPVIACNSGGPIETIKHEVTGFLCDPTPHEFSLAMDKLVEDPNLAERMGEEARQHVIESFSTKVFGQHLNRYVLGVARIKCD